MSISFLKLYLIRINRPVQGDFYYSNPQAILPFSNKYLH